MIPLPYVTPDEEEDFRGYVAPVSAMPADYDAWRLRADEVPDERCEGCGGRGWIQRWDIRVDDVRFAVCPKCGGDGRK